MNNIPSWLDDTPPPDTTSYSRGGHSNGNQRSGYRPAEKPRMSEEQVQAAITDFWTWLNSPQTREQLRLLLPDNVDPDVFMSHCKTAALTRPALLRDDLRQSLLTAVMKAAAQGLMPDGKQGALVERWDSDARAYRVAWQPMVWGIKKLGHETGAIKSIRAVLVFNGETFRVIQGDEDIIEHEVDIDLVDAAYGALNAGRDQHGNPVANPDAFMQHVKAAYCVIHGTDGTVTKRWMTKNRIQSLREASKASKGPWASRWMDEMILKGVILYTSKWINLDLNTGAAKRFQAALMTDMEVDFDAQGRLVSNETEQAGQRAALSAPESKLTALEDAIFGLGRPKENVSVDARPDADAETKRGAGNQTAPLPPAPEPESFQERAAAALDASGTREVWLQTLLGLLSECPTADDLLVIANWPDVMAAKKNAPPEIKKKIAEAERAAAKRLATPETDKPPLDAVLTTGDALSGRVEEQIERVRKMTPTEARQYAASSDYLNLAAELMRTSRRQDAERLIAAMRARTSDD